MANEEVAMRGQGQREASVARQHQRQRRISTAAELEEVQVVRKMFLGGFCFLPWLWVVAVLYFREKATKPEALPDLRWCMLHFRLSTVFCSCLFISHYLN